MTVFVVLRGERGEGAAVVSVYANRSHAEAHAEKIRAAASFLPRVDTCDVEEWPVLEGVHS